jgi:hypothetical protein
MGGFDENSAGAETTEKDEELPPPISGAGPR